MTTLAWTGFLKHSYHRFANDWELAMPLYGYDCNKCGHEFETLVRSSETPSCPSCESTDLTRQLSLIAAPSKSSGDVPMCDGTGSCGMSCPSMCD